MATITTRAGKGSPLTNTEVDDNFSNLNSAKYESGASPTFANSALINSSSTVNLTLDGASANSKNIYFKGDSSAQMGRIASIGTSLYFQLTDATNYFTINPGSTVINDSSVDHDFRIESNDNANMLFVDAATNKLGIGTNAPFYFVEVAGSLQLDATDAQIYLKGGAVGTNSFVNWTFNTNDTIYAKVGIDYDTRATNGFHIDAGYPITIDSSSGTGITFLASTQGINKFSNTSNIFNEKGEDIDFRVESMVSQYTIYMDAQTGHVGFGDSTPSSTVDVNGPISYASRASRKVAGGGANTNYHLIYEKDFQSASSFTTNQHRVVITGAGGTSGQTGSAEFIVNFKQQTSNKFWNIIPIERHGINLCYVWDASGGSQSAGGLKIYAASAGGNYMYMQVDATSRDANPAGDVTRGAFPCTDTGSTTAPTASVVLETPLTVYGNRYNANGHVNKEYVVNEHDADIDFRVESEANAYMLHVDAENSQVLIATSTAFEPSSYGLYARSGLLVGNFSGTGNGFTVRRGDTLKLNINHDSTKGFVTTGGSPLHFRTTENSNYKISMETDGVVINENGQDYDFRIESNGDDYAFFVDGGNDRVVVGSEGTDHVNSKFVVVGRQTIYNGSTTGGSVLLTDGYSASTNDHLLNIGTQRSSGGPFISYGLGHDQNSDGLWKSTYDNFSGNHSVLVLNGATLEYHLDVSNSATTVGNTVALQNGYKVGRSGAVFNDDGYSEFDFRVESDAYASMLFVDGGNNCVSAGGGASPAGSNWGFYAEGQTKDTSSNTYVAAKLAAAAYVDTGEYTTMLGMGVEKSAYWSKGGIGYTRTAGYDVGYLGFYVNGAVTNANLTLADELLRLTASEVVVNDRSRSTVDFRVESDAYTHALAVDASENAIYFGKNTNSDFNQAGMIIRASGEFIVTRASDVATFNRITSDGTLVRWRRQNVTVGQVSVNATSATYHTTSDRRLKKDIETITDGTDKLMAMNPVTHGWKAHPEADTVYGFVAQEMLDIVPEAVAGDPEGDEMMSIDYGRITPVIVAALQDAHKKIAELENRLNELEGK